MEVSAIRGFRAGGTKAKSLNSNRAAPRSPLDRAGELGGALAVGARLAVDRPRLDLCVGAR